MREKGKGERAVLRLGLACCVAACQAMPGQAQTGAGRAGSSEPGSAKRVELTPITDGVWAFLQPADRRFDDGNSTIVILETGVLVVDTHNSPTLARAVIAAVRGLTDLPVRWVLNTHWHGDHVQGNQAYREAFPEAEFIAHAATARDIEARAIPALADDREAVPAWLARARAAVESGSADGQALTPGQLEVLRGQLGRREAYWAAIREVTDFVLPTRTFSDSLTLAGEARLLHFGGHTEGDVAVWLPSRRVLITGDLLDDLPFTGHGSPRGLLETLRAFVGMDFVAIVPGHGSVRRDSRHLRDVIALFESIVRQAVEGRAAGLDADATAERADLSAFRDRFVVDDASARYWPFFTGEALRRAWAEAAGDPTEGGVGASI